MQKASATGFWLRLVSEKAAAPLTPSGFCGMLVCSFGRLNEFEKLVRWLQRHCVTIKLLHIPTVQPDKEKSSRFGS